MYRSAADKIRQASISILAAEAGMTERQAIKTLLKLDVNDLNELSRLVKEHGGAGEAVLAAEKDAAIPSALKAAILALAVLMPTARAGEQAAIVQAIADSKQAVTESRRSTDLATAMIRIGNKKYVASTKGQIEALKKIAKMENMMKEKMFDPSAREEIVRDLIEATGVQEVR